MNKMTNKEINIAIAKALNVRFEKRTACPWCDCNPPYEAGDDYGITIQAECKTCHNTGKIEPYYVGVPNYCNDLNETHQVWQSLTHNQKKQFEIELYRVIIGDGDYNRNDDAMLITNATALQRAKALMKTLNLE